MFKFFLVLLIGVLGSAQSASALQVPLDSTGLGYTNFHVGNVPWSIHVVQVARTNGLYEVQSIHAGNEAVGLDTLSELINTVNPAVGTPVAGINGDFYQRDRTYAGAPRGLQIVDGELISSPGRKIAFWIDLTGLVQAGELTSKFEVTWPDGTVTPFRLNGERSPNGVELYTPAIGASTRTWGGRELVLDKAEGSPWLPLRIGRTYSAVVKEVRDSGGTKMTTNSLVLSLGPGAVRRFGDIQPGAILKISAGTEPSLRGIKTAISGGPLLLHNGHRERIDAGFSESYEFSSMFERHPRAAIGWSPDWFFLVEVDGRQRGLSVGMTLDELASFMQSLGCQEAMNFDGGGSATLWFEGEVRNSPCERAEREIANGLVIVKKKSNGGGSSASARK